MYDLALLKKAQKQWKIRLWSYFDTPYLKICGDIAPLKRLYGSMYERGKNLRKRIFINLERFQSDCKAGNFNINNNIYRFFDIIAIYFLLIFYCFMLMN